MPGTRSRRMIRPAARHVDRRGWPGIVGLLAAAAWLTASPIRGNEPTTGDRGNEPVVFRISVTVDFGKDLGQNWGSLFELHNDQGRVVAGAGFLGAYNTQPRSNRRQLNCFVRNPDRPWTVASQVLPRVNRDAGVYLWNVDGELMAASRSGGDDPRPRRWSPAGQHWVLDEQMVLTSTPVAGGILRVDDRRITYDDRILFRPHDDHLRLGAYYYAAGQLIFRMYSTDAARPHNQLVAVPWQADWSGAPPLDAARRMELRSPREFVYAFGQLAGSVLAATNTGGVYVLDQDGWTVLVEPDLQVSYQVYSMINYYDVLLLGHYPTGELFEFTQQGLTRLSGWPPVMPGVARRAREAQTLSIYAGDLLTGVWPWAEVWRYDRDRDKWFFVRRMFSHPEPTDSVVHPYDEQTRQIANVHNLWGQRVTSMVPFGNSLYVSTSAKSSAPYGPRVAFLADGKWRDYGKVYRWTRPGQLAVHTRWRDGPTCFDISLTKEHFRILQDGHCLGTTRVSGTAASSIEPRTIAWGHGIYGPLAARIQETTVVPVSLEKP